MKYRTTSTTIALGLFLSAVGVQSQLGAHEFIFTRANANRAQRQAAVRIQGDTGFLGKLR